MLRMPTLVLHRRDNRVWDIETSRRVASQIPNARFVELPGAENDIFLGDTAPVLAEIERFLAEPGVVVEHDRVLSTVLFTDMVASTEALAARGDDAWRRFLDDHDHTMARIVADHRGRVVKQLGDGIAGDVRWSRASGAVRGRAHRRRARPRASRCAPVCIPGKSNSGHPMSRESPCISRVASHHWPIGTRSLSPAPSST